MKKIGIVGSRRRNAAHDLDAVVKAFFQIYELGDSIVSGGCPKGGDRFAEIIASVEEVPITIHKADWKLGRHAGFLRNTTIAEESDVLIACVADDRKGGTEDTINKFQRLGKSQHLYLV